MLFSASQAVAIEVDYSAISSGVKLKKESVVPCRFDFSDIDYCDATHLSFFSLQLGLKKPDFFKSYKLLKYKESDTESSLVVIDTAQGKAYPLPFTIGNYVDDKGFSTAKEAVVEFNLNDNKICINGSVYSYKNSVTNDKSCFEFSANGNFKKLAEVTHQTTQTTQINTNNRLRKLKTLSSLPISFICSKPDDMPNSKCSGIDSDWTAVSSDPGSKSWYVENQKKLPSMNQVQLVMLPTINDSTVLLARQLIELDEGNRYSFIIITCFEGGVNYKVLDSEVLIDKNFVIRGRDDQEGTTQAYYRIGSEGSINKIKKPKL